MGPRAGPPAFRSHFRSRHFGSSHCCQSLRLLNRVGGLAPKMEHGVWGAAAPQGRAGGLWGGSENRSGDRRSPGMGGGIWGRSPLQNKAACGGGNPPGPQIVGFQSGASYPTRPRQADHPGVPPVPLRLRPKLSSVVFFTKLDFGSPNGVFLLGSPSIEVETPSRPKQSSFNNNFSVGWVVAQSPRHKIGLKSSASGHLSPKCFAAPCPKLAKRLSPPQAILVQKAAHWLRMGSLATIL